MVFQFLNRLSHISRTSGNEKLCEFYGDNGKTLVGKYSQNTPPSIYGNKYRKNASFGFGFSILCHKTKKNKLSK